MIIISGDSAANSNFRPRGVWWCGLSSSRLLICIHSARFCSMLTISSVGDRPSGEFTKSGSSNHALNFASDLLTAEGVTFIRFAALVTLRSCISSCRQSSRLRSSVVMDFFMSGNGASRRDEHNQQQARSEEHTSELQSRFDLVCRLLLEKKNNK